MNKEEIIQLAEYLEATAEFLEKVEGNTNIVIGRLQGIALGLKLRLTNQKE